MIAIVLLLLVIHERAHEGVGGACVVARGQRLDQVVEQPADLALRDAAARVGADEGFEPLVALGRVLLETTDIAGRGGGEAIGHARLDGGVDLHPDQAVELAMHRLADGTGDDRRDDFGRRLLQARGAPASRRRH